MSDNKNNFYDHKYSHLVSRRDYAKIDIDFEEPDLLAIQKTNYNDHLKDEIESLIKAYFPVKHPKSKYEVQYVSLKLASPVKTEEEARYAGETYERPLYVDLQLVNNETGEVGRAKKSKDGKSDGILFAWLPMMTDKGTFIVNGIEKFVISQIVRSPGVYALNSAAIKLNSKKKVNEGYICEVLPARGTLMNFKINQNTNVKLEDQTKGTNVGSTVEVVMRNSLGDSAPTFPATQLLKALGLTQDEIREIFKDDYFILNTLFSDKIYNHQNILDTDDIRAIRKTADDVAKGKTADRGSPIDNKLKKVVFEYVHDEESVKKTRAEYEAMYGEISTQLEDLTTQINKASGKTREELNTQKEKLSKPVYVILDKLEKQEQKLRSLLDIIITEKAAKDLIRELKISTKTAEINATDRNPICHQDILAKHFMDTRQYDLTSAGRYKIQRKLRISERLYKRIIAEDLITKQGKTLLTKNTLILKPELDAIKDAISHDELNIHKVKINAIANVLKDQPTTLESILVYTDNEKQEFTTSIIGPHENNKSHALTLVDFISTISYTVGLPHGIGQIDDIDHLGNKRIRLIVEQLKNKLQAGMARVEKHIKDKLSSISIPTANDEQKAKIAARTTVKSIVNTNAFKLAVKNFFNSYQLTQFIDQQNPLSELTNKRRISAMGDGGISREDPNLDIRDVHYSHYGRICPIETPEGMNIGLIMSLAAFTKVNPDGFLETPYYIVKNGVITKEVE
ncbi:hypothetical protein FACS1894166_11070 [Bacilli bacterium]|nr:hypothetical protein FACS1894166_11070 [Bacilli bacterium]